MIGVVAKAEDRQVVRELFELFKTPWEFFIPGGEYEIILAPVEMAPTDQHAVRILFGADSSPDEERRMVSAVQDGAWVQLRRNHLPLYGPCRFFESGAPEFAVEVGARSAVIRVSPSTVRVGYDLYREIRHLLEIGQPEDKARIPTLELHISLIRELILDAGISLFEIPPVPAGHPFSVCLTHDVDHPVMRKHKADHTALGFLWRATLGSVIQALRGRLRLRALGRNVLAALRFPFVQVGLAKDPWAGFDRYLEIERGVASTFFVISRSGAPGKGVDSPRAARRAVPYTLDDIRPQLTRLREAGAEIALHGIDAWTNLDGGRSERGWITDFTGAQHLGVRMHWLCFDRYSPRILDQAGFSYDSTSGYNSTVGYRAGTLQAFRPLGTERLLELPLHLMDTALFYPSYLNLSPAAAGKVMRRFIADAVNLGGVLVINWHDRSIAPERQWESSYRDLLEELRRLDPWFATASQAAAWFRWRRSVTFEEVRQGGKVVQVKVKAAGPEIASLPGFRLRLSRRKPGPVEAHASSDPVSCVEHVFFEEAAMDLAA